MLTSPLISISVPNTSSQHSREGANESKRRQPSSGRSVDDAVFRRSDPRHRQLLSSPNLGCMRTDHGEGLQMKPVGGVPVFFQRCCASHLLRIKPRSLKVRWCLSPVRCCDDCYNIISGTIWGITVSYKVAQLAQGESNGCYAFKETVPLNFNWGPLGSQMPL